MSIIDRAFSIHDDAMILRSHRTSILAANIANADTPDYKARDMDFSSMLKQAATGQGNKLNMAQMNHICQQVQLTLIQILNIEIRYMHLWMEIQLTLMLSRPSFLKMQFNIKPV